MTITGTHPMVMDGTTGMEVVGECITTLGRIQTGDIMTLGIQVIMATGTETGTILGGVITVTEDATAVITVTTTITATEVVGIVVAATEI